MLNKNWQAIILLFTTVTNHAYCSDKTSFDKQVIIEGRQSTEIELNNSPKDLILIKSNNTLGKDDLIQKITLRDCRRERLRKNFSKEQQELDDAYQALENSQSFYKTDPYNVNDNININDHQNMAALKEASDYTGLVPGSGYKCNVLVEDILLRESDSYIEGQPWSSDTDTGSDSSKKSSLSV